MAEYTAYEILEVAPSASAEDIKAAYYRKAKVYHPDTGGKVEDFLAIQRAYHILSNEKTRELLGRQKKFDRLSMRLQPSSMESNLSVLLQNIDALRDKIQKAGAR